MAKPAEIWASLGSIINLLYRPVTHEEIAAAELALGVKLPPSYVELVTSVGAPAIAPRRDLSAEHLANLGYGVMRPDEIVQWTRELRESPQADQADSPEELATAQANLANAIWFQIGCNAGEGFVFLIDTVDSAGEMRVGDYHHDYLYELDWRVPNGAVFESFEAVTEHVADAIRRYIAEYDVW